MILSFQKSANSIVKTALKRVLLTIAKNINWSVNPEVLVWEIVTYWYAFMPTVSVIFISVFFFHFPHLGSLFKPNLLFYSDYFAVIIKVFCSQCTYSMASSYAYIIRFFSNTRLNFDIRPLTGKRDWITLKLTIKKLRRRSRITSVGHKSRQPCVHGRRVVPV